MARERESVVCTPVVVGLGKVLNELVQDHLVIIVTHLLPVANRPNQAGQVVAQIVTPSLLESGGEMIRPRESAGGPDVRFIGKRAQDAFAELVANLLLVSVERYFQELLRHAGVHEVDITAIAMPGRVGRASDGCDQVISFG